MSQLEYGFFGPRVINPSFGGGSKDKPWRGMMVDSELKDDWLKRLNGIPGFVIRSVCAGGRDHSSASPLVFFHYGSATGWPSSQKEGYKAWVSKRLLDLGFIEVKDQSQTPIGAIAFMLTAYKSRILMTPEHFDGWWEAVVDRLEDLPRSLPLEYTRKD